VGGVRGGGGDGGAGEWRGVDTRRHYKLVEGTSGSSSSKPDPYMYIHTYIHIYIDTSKRWRAPEIDPG